MISIMTVSHFIYVKRHWQNIVICPECGQTRDLSACRMDIRNDSQRKTNQLNIEMTINYEDEESDKRFLDITLINRGDDFEYSPADLPWYRDGSMTILLADKVTKLSGLALQLNGYFFNDSLIDDTSVHSVKLAKNDRISGKVYLLNRYPDLSKKLESESIDLFWSYQLRDIKGNSSGKMGGWIYLPKD